MFTCNWVLRRVAIGMCLLFLCSPIAAQKKNQSRTSRAAVQNFFSLLKSQQYAALYEFLPTDLQQQMTREQLAQSLKRLESFLVIERMEIKQVQERGDFAVVDTAIYGQLKRPPQLNGEEVKEGRISAQQYLFKENGQWKVVSADERTRNFFLKRNPDFDKQFRLASPLIEFKQRGQWTKFNGAPRKPSKP